MVVESRSDDLLEKVEHLNLWQRGDERAPHKPLLLLFYLARIQQGADRLLPFAQIDAPLRTLLQQFGPPRKSYHSEYPFWRLQNDGIWEVQAPDDLKLRASNTDARRRELLRHNVPGGLTQRYFDTLRRNPSLIQRVARSLLESHFPPSLHEDIADSVGLTLTWSPRVKSIRDHTFRQRVLQAYDYRCAVCGFDVRLGAVPIGLEAAHIKWHQANGPDIVQNGLCLCTLHHKAFDLGAVTISEDHEVLLSADLSGGQHFSPLFLDLVDLRLKPQTESLLPRIEFLRWHHQQVFRRPDRHHRLV